MSSAHPSQGNTERGATSTPLGWLSEERLNQLRPRLNALMEDFGKLEELAGPATEPGIAPDYEGYNDGQR